MTYTPQQQYAQLAVDVPLSAPLYGASAPNAVIRFFKKYATFSGRASGSEYWYWSLFNNIVSLLLCLLVVLAIINDAELGLFIAMALWGVWLLVILVPGTALMARRLHDLNLSGWMQLLGLIPILGGIALLVFVLMDARPEGQQFDQPATV